METCCGMNEQKTPTVQKKTPVTKGDFDGVKRAFERKTLLKEKFSMNKNENMQQKSISNRRTTKNFHFNLNLNMKN
jgi:hypothetical protein